MGMRDPLVKLLAFIEHLLCARSCVTCAAVNETSPVPPSRSLCSRRATHRQISKTSGPDGREKEDRSARGVADIK